MVHKKGKGLRCGSCRAVMAERIPGAFREFIASVTCWRCAHPAYHGGLAGVA